MPSRTAISTTAFFTSIGNCEVTYSYYPGWQGSYYEPPEAAEASISSVALILETDEVIPLPREIEERIILELESSSEFLGHVEQELAEDADAAREP